MGDLSRFQLRGLLSPGGQHFQHREIGLTAGLVQTQADFAVDLSDGYSDDVDKVLPEAGALETARSYREKKAKPLWAKIVKVLRSVYRAYLDLKSKFERLQADYGREVSKNSSLSERIYEVCAERDSLKGKVRDYERVRRAIGPEQADRILEAAYQQEHAEKERKRAAKSKIRIDAR